MLFVILVAKKSSMFNDPIMEIQELTALIKTDITTLNSAVLDLQNIQKIDLADENYSEDRVVHSNAVCDDLKNRLMGATKHLQDVLTTRTEVNMLITNTVAPIFLIEGMSTLIHVIVVDVSGICVCRVQMFVLVIHRSHQSNIGYV